MCDSMKVSATFSREHIGSKISTVLASAVTWLLVFSGYAYLEKTTVVLIVAACLFAMTFIVPIFWDEDALFDVKTDNKWIEYAFNVLSSIMLILAGLIIALPVWFLFLKDIDIFNFLGKSFANLLKNTKR